MTVKYVALFALILQCANAQPLNDLLRTNRQTDDYAVYTKDGIIYKGGKDLPAYFKGSGNADFAFPGESFRNSPETRQPNRMRNTITSTEIYEDISNNVIPGREVEISSTSRPNENTRYTMQCQHNCHRSTGTAEYNPVCGSDRVTYMNPSRFRCAVRCGKQITGRPYVTCGAGSTVV